MWENFINNTKVIKNEYLPKKNQEENSERKI